MTSYVAALLRGAHALSLFTRLHLAGFTLVVALLGAGTAASSLTGVQIAAIVGVALGGHIFGYVLNDVIDLPLDRTEPQRADYPLVQGTIKPWQALAIALVQFPLALVLTSWLSNDGWAYATLGACFVLAAVYNVWGKRFLRPPLGDVVQALGAGGLAVYGALAVGGWPTRLTGIVSAFAFVYIVMINGVHASLRDLANDLACGMRTTAILLGVRPQGKSRFIIPRQFKVYVLTLQIVLSGLILVPLIKNWFGYQPLFWVFTLGATLLLNMLSWLLLGGIAMRAAIRQHIYMICIVHASIWLTSLVMLFALYLDRELLVIVLVVHLGGFLLNSASFSRMVGSSTILGPVDRFEPDTSSVARRING